MTLTMPAKTVRISIVLFLSLIIFSTSPKAELMPEAVGIDVIGAFYISPADEFIFIDSSSTLPADGISFFFLDMFLVDANGDFVDDWANEDTSVTATGSATATLSCNVNTSNGKTYCEPQIRNTVAETVTLTFTLNGTNYNLGDFTFRTAADINNTTMTLSGSIVPDADGLDSTTLYFFLGAANGSALFVGGDYLFVTTTGDAEISDVIDYEDGSYSVTITNTTIETVDLSLNINNVAFLENFGSVTFRSTPIAANTSVTQTGSINPDSDGIDITTFTFQLNDSSNNPTTVGGDQVTVSSTGTAVVSAVIDNNNGTYTVNLTDTVGETVSISIEVNGTTRPNIASVTFNGGPPPAGPADAINSVVSVSGANLEANGIDAWNLTIQLVDASNMALNMGGDQVIMSASGDATVSAVVDNGNGTYSAMITNMTAETISVDLTINGTVVNSIVSTTFSAGVADATQTQITSTPNDDGTVDLVIQLADANGNPVTNGGADIIVETTGGASANGVTDNGDGTYLVTISNTAGGASDISLSIDGQASGVVLAGLDVPGEPEPEPVTPLNINNGGGGSLNWFLLLVLGAGFRARQLTSQHL